MKKLILILLFIISCEENIITDTSKNTYYDDISDITFLNDSFFTTNYDLSGNSGSQIDLLKFKFTNDNSIFIDNSYELNMNGQGYIAIANNGTDLFMQSKESHLLIKCSSIGEIALMTKDTLIANWQPCGITVNSDNDSLISLFRNLDTLSQYRVISMSQDLSFANYNGIQFNFDFVDTTYHGIYAIDYKDDYYYMLGVDTSYKDILIITNTAFQIAAVDTISDNTVVGLSFKGNDLFLSYRNRKIEKWETY